jgi:hypothetical protein
MANPTNRQEFAAYCLRALGAPVLEINVSDEQVDDRIDFALKTWWDYHFDGSEKCYYKYIIQAKDFPGHVSEIEVANSGIGYSNTDTVSITSIPAEGGSGASASITTNGNGAIISATVVSAGTGYLDPPTATVTSVNGKGGVLKAYNGGYIPVPENIIGAVNIFDITSTLYGGSANMFNIQYQIALNDLYNLTSVSVLPYYSARMQLSQMAELFVGKQPIRYNRHRNKVYLDMDWQKIPAGTILVVEAYEIVDPDAFDDAWNDRWLLQYATAQIKKQWGNNIKKYQGMRLPGGIEFSGQQIYNEAESEIKELEQRMIIDYGYPVTDMIG